MRFPPSDRNAAWIPSQSLCSHGQLATPRQAMREAACWNAPIWWAVKRRLYASIRTLSSFPHVAVRQWLGKMLKGLHKASGFPARLPKVYALHKACCGVRLEATLMTIAARQTKQNKNRRAEESGELLSAAGSQSAALQWARGVWEPSKE